MLIYKETFLLTISEGTLCTKSAMLAFAEPQNTHTHTHTGRWRTQSGSEAGSDVIILIDKYQIFYALVQMKHILQIHWHVKGRVQLLNTGAILQ